MGAPFIDSRTHNPLPGLLRSMAEVRPPGRRILGRHRSLLRDPRVRAWWRERSLRSRLSADTYLRHIGLFCERLRLRPRGLVELARSRPELLRRRLVEFARSQQQRGRLDSYIAKSFEGLRSFLRHQQVPFTGIPVLTPIRGASLARERVPTPEELDRVLAQLSRRGRVIGLFLSDTGLRPGVLGSYGGEDGLTLADLPELTGAPATVTIPTVPFLIRVPARLSKTRREYLTFGTERLARALEEYFAERIRRGEPLGPQSPVIAPGTLRGCAARSRQTAAFGRGFLTTKAVTREIHQGLAMVCPEGVTWRPYVLRAYCSTRLLLAEGRGLISRDLREAILGHSGGVAARYHVGKRWGPELVEEARRQYRCAAYLLEPGDPEASAAPRRTGEREGPASVPAVRPFRLRVAEQRLAEGWRYIGPFGSSRVLLAPPESSHIHRSPRRVPEAGFRPGSLEPDERDSGACPSTCHSDEPIRSGRERRGPSTRSSPKSGPRAESSRPERDTEGTEGKPGPH